MQILTPIYIYSPPANPHSKFNTLIETTGSLWETEISSCVVPCVASVLTLIPPLQVHKAHQFREELQCRKFHLLRMVELCNPKDQTLTICTLNTKFVHVLHFHRYIGWVTVNSYKLIFHLNLIQFTYGNHQKINKIWFAPPGIFCVNALF